jgi:uncharacterized protein involved in exopolysaccharide biosynthesis
VSDNAQVNSGGHASQFDDEIDLLALFSVLWRRRWFALLFVVFAAVVSVVVSLRLPNVYASHALLVPVQKDAGGGLASMASQFGGLASLAGVNLNKEASKSDQAVEFVKSWPFWDEFLKKHSLKAELFAAKGYDRERAEIIFDDDIFSQDKRWVRKPREGFEPEPSTWEVFRAVQTKLQVSVDKKTGFVTIKFEHVSPAFAKSLVDKLIVELNAGFQRKDKDEATKNIEFLSNKARETSLANMQTVFYSMIENQMKVLMLAESTDEYLFKILVKPMVSEEKVGPKRSIIVVVSCLMALFVFFVFALVRGKINKEY